MRTSGGYIIAVANTKGGTGKTTLSTSLAVYLAAIRKRVGLVALDPQADLISWLDLRAREGHEPKLERFAGLDELDEIAERIDTAGIDVLVIDCPPHFLHAVQAALLHADLTVIPIKAGGFDLMAHDDIMAAVVANGVPHIVVLNESPPAWAMTKAARKMLEAKGHRVASTEVRTRADYRSAALVGLTAAEIERGEEAANEIAALWREIEKALRAARKAASREVRP